MAQQNVSQHSSIHLVDLCMSIPTHRWKVTSQAMIGEIYYYTVVVCLYMIIAIIGHETWFTTIYDTTQALWGHHMDST